MRSYKIRKIAKNGKGVDIYGITIPKNVKECFNDVSFVIQASGSGISLGSCSPNQKMIGRHRDK